MKSLDIEAARAVAFRFLGFSERTRAELHQRLTRDEFPAGIVEAVLAELTELGYVDDSGFARHWIEDRADRKKYGRTRLAAELHRKGVDRETASDALNSISEDEEFARALAAAGARWDGETLRALDAKARAAEKSRVTGFLMRRGFSWQTVKKVLASLLENTE